MGTRALLLLTGLNLLDYLDRYLLAALASLIKEELSLSGRAYGFLGTAFFLVYLVTSPLFGWLGDRYGRLRLMAAGAALWSVATSLTAWVSSYPWLVLTRGLVGVGEASFGTLAPAYMADRLPLNRRSAALGIFYLAIPVGAALAYLAGGFLGSRFGWRPVFLLGGVPGLLLAWSVTRLPAAALAPPTNPEKAIDPQASFLALWRVPTLRRLMLGYGMTTFTLGGLAFWMPRFLEVAKGLSLAQANYLLFGAVTVAGGLGTVIGGYLGSRLMARRAHAPLWLSAGGALFALPLGALAIFAAAPELYIPGIVGAIFLLFLNPGLLTAVVVSVAGPARRARAVALNIIVIHLVGDVPSPFLIGLVADVWHLTAGVALTLVALVLAGAFFLAAVPHVEEDLRRAGETGAPLLNGV
ncbi:MAG: MFS transporter [Desulfobaccales bacterium]